MKNTYIIKEKVYDKNNFNTSIKKTIIKANSNNEAMNKWKNLYPQIIHEKDPLFRYEEINNNIFYHNFISLINS